MLKTCLKHDLRAYRRYFYLMSFLMLSLSIVGSVLIRFYIESFMSTQEGNLNAMFMVLSMLLVVPGSFCIVLLIMAPVATGLMSLWRMYTHFYTDQGYLTFTLPVKRSTLYLSKVLSTLIMEIVTILELILAALLIALVVPPTGGDGLFNFTAYQAIGNFFSNAWEFCGAWLIAWILLGIILLVAISVASMGLYYLCLTIGAVVAKKHKLIAGIGIYYLVNMLFSFVANLIASFFLSGLTTAVTLAYVHGYGPLSVCILLLMSTAIAAVIGICFHFSALGQVERRLNLA